MEDINIFEDGLKNLKKEGKLNMLVNGGDRDVIGKIYNCKLNKLLEELYGCWSSDEIIDEKITNIKWLDLDTDPESYRGYTPDYIHFVFRFTNELVFINKNFPNDFKIIDLY